MLAMWKDWAFDRFGLRPLKEEVLDRKVPRTPWYYGDGATLLTLFGVQAVTGAVLALNYSPSIDHAYQSVQYITNEAALGWLVRGLHYWSAGLMMVMLFFHLFRVILVGGYKPPREGTWLIGVLLFFAVLIMGFSGYLLRWDERAVYATSLVLHMFEKTPLVGEWLVRFVQGGDEIGAKTLTRMHALHVIWVPALIGILIAFHLYLVIRQGTTTPSEREQPVRSAEEQKALYEQDSRIRGETFYPETVAKSALMTLFVVLLIGGLAFFTGPLAMYPEANLVEPSMPEEEWWFWWYSGLIATVPEVAAPWVIVLFAPVLFLTLVLLPFLDRNPHRKLRHRPFIVIGVSLSIALLLWLSIQRVRSPWTGWPTDKLPPVPEGAILSASAEAGRSLYTHYGCSSCHAIDGEGPQVGPDLAELSRILTRDQLLLGILSPPRDSSMPLNYGERMRPEEIEQVLDYLMLFKQGEAEISARTRETNLR